MILLILVNKKNDKKKMIFLQLRIKILLIFKYIYIFNNDYFLNIIIIYF